MQAKKLLGIGLALFLSWVSVDMPAMAASQCECQSVPVPLDKPNQRQVAIEIFANEAAVSAFSFDYANYRKQLNLAATYFTPAAWQAFMKGLKTSGNLDRVIDRKMVVRAVAEDAPVIESQGVVNNRYSWVLRFPLLITYNTEKDTVKQRVDLKIEVTRSSDLMGMNGIVVSQFEINPVDVKQ